MAYQVSHWLSPPSSSQQTGGEHAWPKDKAGASGKQPASSSLPSSSAYLRVLQLLPRNQWLANEHMVASCPILDPKHVERWRAEVMATFCSHGDWASGTHSRLAFTSHSQSVEVSLLPWPSALRSDWVTVQATAHPSSCPGAPEEGSPLQMTSGSEVYSTSVSDNFSSDHPFTKPWLLPSVLSAFLKTICFGSQTPL